MEKLVKEVGDVEVKFYDAEGNYKTAKQEFDSLAKAEIVEFSSDELDSLVDSVNSNIKRSKNNPNNYDLNKGIEKQLSIYDKESKVYDEQKAIYENAKANRTPEQGQEGPNNGEQNNNEGQKLGLWARFMNWIKGEKQEQLPAPAPTPAEGSEKTHKEFVK